MKQYLELLARVLDEGWWSDNRTGIKTRAIPSATLVHDMEHGYPLLTTKRVAFKSMAVELEGFIKAVTDVAWYQERGCTIWDEWAKEDGALGPFYGYQWRHYSDRVDQLRNILDTLKTNPTDRRMICMAWNPLYNDEMALPPCHIGWKVDVIGGKLHLTWWQRSCDLFLGIPFNLASYALLLHLISKHVGIPAGTVTGQLSNVHLYENHLAQAQEQYSREPRELPYLYWKGTDLLAFDHRDVELMGYRPHPKIAAEVAV
jgi:thymidylate synthase